MFGHRKLAALVAEFIGTYVLVSVVLAMATRTQFPFFAAVVAGSLLALMVMTIGRVSGAHLNPAVTVGLWSLRKIQTTQAIIYVGVQMLAGFTALRVGQLLLDTKLDNIAGTNFDWPVIAAEALGALLLGLGVAAAVHYKEDGSRLATTVGLSLALGMVVASLGGAGLINPAMALGLNTWSASYIIGPIVGAVVGMNIYVYLFAPLEKSRAIKK